jgi:hypothetical protein
MNPTSPERETIATKLKVNLYEVMQRKIIT